MPFVSSHEALPRGLAKLANLHVSVLTEQKETVTMSLDHMTMVYRQESVIHSIIEGLATRSQALWRKKVDIDGAGYYYPLKFPSMDTLLTTLQLLYKKL